MDNSNLTAQIEALLFTSPGAVTTNQIAEALQVTKNQVKAGLDKLQTHYLENQWTHGLRVQSHQGRYQLTTAPELSEAIERFFGLDATSRLSQAALEALAIVAYQEPVTRPQIDAIRGVNSDAVLKNLLNKGLIQEMGRAMSPGRPILYSTTAEFLQHFGLNSLEELPPLLEMAISHDTGLPTNNLVDD